MQLPKISVVVPARNAGEFVSIAVQSALAPTRRCRVELIVVDHASTDNTVDEAMAGARWIHDVKFVRAAEGGNCARAKNAGLAVATGEFVTFHDADDVMVVGSLDARVKVLVDDPKADAVFGRIAGLIDKRGRLFRDDAFEAWIERGYDEALSSRPPGLNAKQIADGRLPGYATLVYRRNSLPQGGFDESLTCAEDFDYAYRIAKGGGRIAFADEPCLFYRVHGKNTSVFISGDGHVVPMHDTLLSHQAALKKHGLAKR